MVSSRQAIMIVMAFTPFLLIYESDSASCSQIDCVGIPEFASSQKVNLSVYYESLNPTCANFIIKDLAEIFNKDLIDIVNLQLVPWANSHINKTNNSISCQNGTDECQLNSLESCVLNDFHDVNKYYALIFCFEFLAIEGRLKNLTNCFSQLGLPEKLTLDCYRRGNGTELGRKYINETAHLSPPHTFLPWVVVNNKPLGKDYANFTSYVCEAYNGIAKPAVCKSG
ncbi:hypothetical protein L6164_028778 [Bauhinia variegata]|uniref:Uncharacterized protein n=1 Tax=Bauhinia variegata TaxID=167791 RepID=A0ACB9L6Q3_BAUVA|nr:hypothetical protein L6164_028778 [Bauhinia variegata]